MLEHQLRDRGGRRKPSEVSAELPGARRSEGHVLPQDLTLGAVGLNDRVQRHVGVGRLNVITHLDVRKLGPTENAVPLFPGRPFQGDMSWRSISTRRERRRSTPRLPLY